MISKSTHYAKQGEVQRNWVLVDADGAVLGRLATQIAMILRGKNKPQFTPNSDCGDFVVVINADKVQLTGNKADTKTYYRHSGYNGGLKAESFRQAMEKHPEKVIERAVVSSRKSPMLIVTSSANRIPQFKNSVIMQ